MKLLMLVFAFHILFSGHVNCNDEITFTTGTLKIPLNTSDLKMFHMCLCNASNINCFFGITNTSKLTPFNSSSSKDSETYNNLYTCILSFFQVNCTRMKKSNNKDPLSNNEIQVFIMTNRASCNLTCVVVLGIEHNISKSAIENKTGNARQGVCPSQNTSQSVAASISQLTTVEIAVIITAVTGIIIITAVTAISYVCIKRKSAIRKTFQDAISSDNCQHPDKDDAPENLYYSIESKETSLHEDAEETDLEYTNMYSRLHDNPIKITSPYDTFKETF